MALGVRASSEEGMRERNLTLDFDPPAAWPVRCRSQPSCKPPPVVHGQPLSKLALLPLHTQWLAAIGLRSPWPLCGVSLPMASFMPLCEPPRLVPTFCLLHVFHLWRLVSAQCALAERFQYLAVALGKCAHLKSNR